MSTVQPPFFFARPLLLVIQPLLPSKHPSLLFNQPLLLNINPSTARCMASFDSNTASNARGPASAALCKSLRQCLLSSVFCSCLSSFALQTASLLDVYSLMLTEHRTVFLLTFKSIASPARCISLPAHCCKFNSVFSNKFEITTGVFIMLMKNYSW